MLEIPIPAALEGFLVGTTPMQRYIDSGRIAGMVTLVARHGKIAHFETQRNQRAQTLTFYANRIENPAKSHNPITS